MQYLRILFSSLGEEDFQKFCIKLTMFKLFLAIKIWFLENMVFEQKYDGCRGCHQYLGGTIQEHDKHLHQIWI